MAGAIGDILHRDMAIEEIGDEDEGSNRYDSREPGSDLCIAGTV